MKKAAAGLLIAFFLLFFTSNCTLFHNTPDNPGDSPGGPVGNPADLVRGEGKTGPVGYVAFEDPRVNVTVEVETVDSSTRMLLDNIEVEYVSDGVHFFLVATDPASRYMPYYYEGSFSQPLSKVRFGVSPVSAQVPLKIVLALLQIKGHIEAYEDAKSIFYTDRPNVSNWNWEYHEECWTHDQLNKAINVEIELLGLIFPVKKEMLTESGVRYADEIDQLAALVNIVSGEGINIAEYEDRIFRNLPDPVLLRIYHLPSPKRLFSVAVSGECSQTQANAKPTQSFGDLFTAVSVPPETVAVSHSSGQESAAALPTSTPRANPNTGGSSGGGPGLNIPDPSGSEIRFDNGVIKQLTTSLSYEDAVKYYRTQMAVLGWGESLAAVETGDIRGGLDAYLLFESGGARAIVLVSGSSGLTFVTVGNQTWDFGCPGSQVPADFPIPDQRVGYCGVTYAETQGQYRAVEVTLMTLMSKAEVERFYEAQLLANGWVFQGAGGIIENSQSYRKDGRTGSWLDQQGNRQELAMDTLEIVIEDTGLGLTSVRAMTID